MEITYLGHSCFRIRGRDASIVTDPFSAKYGVNMGRPNASIVTVSHEDDYHSFTSGVTGEPHVINGPGEYEIADVLVNGVRTYSRKASEANGGGGMPKLNTVYVIDVDDLRVCHLGDLTEKLTDEQIESLGSVNILLVPVGGGDTIGSSTAAEVVSQIEPHMVVPMHYRTDGTRSEALEPVDRFLRDMGTTTVEPVPKLSVTAKGSMPSDIQVIVLEHRK